MLFLPPFESNTYEFLTIDAPHIKFVIDDKLYCMNYRPDMRMTAIDIKTLKVERVEVDLDDFAVLIRLYQTVLIHNNRAYIWNYDDQYFYEGTVQDDSFHWKEVYTRNNRGFDINNLSFGYHQGDDSFFCIVDYERGRGVHVIYRVNLNEDTKTWTKHITRYKDKYTNKHMKIKRLENDEYDRIFVTGNTVHLFSSKYGERRTKAHLVLDLLSLEWSIDSSYTKQKGLPHSRKTEFFSDNCHIWMVSDTTNNFQSVVHRYDETQSEWIKMGEITDDDNYFRSRSMPICVGTRVIFLNSISANRSNSRVRSLLYVLELEPTLFDLASAAIARDRRVSRLARFSLPQKMRKLLVARRLLNEEEDEEDMENEEEVDEEKEEREREYWDDEDDWSVDDSAEEESTDAQTEYLRCLKLQRRFIELTKLEKGLRGGLDWITQAEDIYQDDTEEENGETENSAGEESREDDAIHNEENTWITNFNRFVTNSILSQCSIL